MSETLLIDTFEFVPMLEESTVSEANGPYKMKGLFQRAQAKNGNGRLYPKHLLEREVEKLIPLIKERRLMGEIDHPEDPKIHLDKVSHLITDLKVEGNDVLGTLEILDGVPAGALLRGLVKSGVKLGISSRGTGSLKEDRDLGASVVQEDFNLITWDIVGDPSTPGAWVGLSESKLRKDFADAAKIMERERVLNRALTFAAAEIFKV